MAISRPLLLALIGVVMLAATFNGARLARDGDEGDRAASPAGAQVNREAPPSDRSRRAPRRRADTGQRRGSEGRERSPRASRDRVARKTGIPQPVARALGARRIVVLFFYQPGSADDRATATAVASLRRDGRHRAAVFSAPVARVADYRRVIGEVGVSRAPAIVIVGRDGRARLLEGFVDPDTLRQAVVDAR